MKKIENLGFILTDNKGNFSKDSMIEIANRVYKIIEYINEKEEQRRVCCPRCERLLKEKYEEGLENGMRFQESLEKDGGIPFPGGGDGEPYRD